MQEEKISVGQGGEYGEINPDAAIKYKNFRKPALGFFPVVKRPVKDGGPSALVYTLSFKPGLSLEQKFNTFPQRKFYCPAVTLPNSDI